MDIINLLLPTIEHFRILGYWIIFLAGVLESLIFVGLAIPGTIFVLVTGALSAQGYLDLGDLIWFVALGAACGDLISFLLGKKLIKRERKWLSSEYVVKGRNFFGKHGGKSIFFGRFVGPLRSIIPFVAGMASMNFWKFLAWNLFSALLWAATLSLGGYFFGQALQQAGLLVEKISVYAVGIAAFALAAYVARRFWRNIRQSGKELNGGTGRGII